MAKGLVEKYQQILESDPGSLVFVELAKALLDRGEPRQAAEVCAKGVEHHPESIVGRVLWGKALIGCGKPADAMEQFDKAVAVEPENPLAYNLIGEVLLHKGLHRSALPILRKAVALQPQDTRVRQWLDQAQRALTGAAPAAPTPEMTTVDGRGTSDVHAEPTVVDVKAYVPGAAAPGAETVRGITDIFKSLGGESTAVTQALPASPAPAPAAPAVPIPPAPAPVEGVPWLESPSSNDLEGRTTPISGTPEAVLAASSPAADAPAPTPAPVAPLAPATEKPAEAPAVPEQGAALESSTPTSGEEVVPGLTGVFQSLAARAQEAETSAAPPAPEVAAAPKPSSLLPELDGLSAAAPSAPPAPPPPPRTTSEPSIQISPELLGPPPLPPGAPAPAPTAPHAPPSSRSKLLPDLPSMPPAPATSEEMPSVVIAPEAAADIAREFERELREKLLATPPPTFWRKHWLALSLSAAAIVVGIVSLLVYKGTREQNRGNDLVELRRQTFRALALNTPVGYRQSIELAERALALANDADAQAALAYSNAALYRFAGQEPGRKAEAEKRLPALREKHPGLALAVPYLVASDAVALEAAKAPLLAARADALPKGFEGAEVQSLAGRLLLSGGKPEEALARFKAALDADPAHVATLVALGDYYLAQAEPEQALKWLSLAKGASPEHLPALLGVVQAKLALGGEGNDPAADLDAAKAAFAAGEGTAAAWPGGYRMDLDLAEGRVLALQGRLADASAKLSAGATEHQDRAADFYAALGSIQALAGNYDQAESAYRKAVDRRAADPSLREELARALIARGKDAEALKVTEGSFADDRRLRIVRGLALLNRGQLAKAREELSATQRNGKVPAEAAIYLAQVDAASGQREVARSFLQAAAKAAKGRGAAHVALAQMMIEDGQLAEAQAELAAAEADRRDWEGACSLGRLHLRAGRFTEARQHLSLSVERNKFHVEARLALGQALLALGEAGKAQGEFEQALAQSPTAGTHRGLARAMLAQGDLAGARGHIQAAAKLEPRAAETTRLAAQLALASGDAQEALKSLERAAKANPRDPVAWCDLGETLVKVGANAAAAKAFDTALRNDRGNPRARLGLVAAALPKQARRVLKEADALVHELDKDPTHKARALALAARVHLALADRTGAAALAKRAVEADDASADAHFAQALVASAAKDDAIALSELSRVVATDPALAEAHLALAASLMRDPASQPRAVASLEAYLRIAPTGPDALTARKLLAALQKKLEKDGAAPK